MTRSFRPTRLLTEQPTESGTCCNLTANPIVSYDTELPHVR